MQICDEADLSKIRILIECLDVVLLADQAVVLNVVVIFILEPLDLLILCLVAQNVETAVFAFIDSLHLNIFVDCLLQDLNCHLAPVNEVQAVAVFALADDDVVLQEKHGLQVGHDEVPFNP